MANGQCATYQENDRDVEQESNRCVGQQSHKTDTVHISHGHLGKLGEEQDESVDDSASRGIVVEGDERVHLEIGTAEQALNHDQTDSLENDTSALEEETDHDELDLSHRGNDDTNNDEGHISERLQVDRRNSETPGGEKDGDGHSSLQRSVAATLFISGLDVP
jgi:hypothetical protein